MPLEQLDLFAYTFTPEEVCTAPPAPKPPQSNSDWLVIAQCQLRLTTCYTLLGVTLTTIAAIAHYQSQADYYLTLISRFVKFGLPPEPGVEQSEPRMRHDHPARKHEITCLSAMREQAIAKIKELTQ
jgi:hypothetical protein